MFGKALIAFSCLLAVANAGPYGPAVIAHGGDAATVSVKQDTHSFGYKVDEVNTRGYAVAAPVVHAAPAVVAHAAPVAPLAYAAPAVHAAPLAYGAPLATSVVTKTVGVAAPAVVHAAPALGYAAAPWGYAAPLAYAKRPYAFGYAYGAASPALAYAAPHAYAAPVVRHHY